MNMPLVSVIVPTYNHEKYIGETLDSILRQKVNFEYEIIVGEDSSEDNTRKIIKQYEKKYAEKMVCVYRKDNLGGKRNSEDIIFDRVRGQYIAFCEGDDNWCAEDKLQKQIDFLRQNPKYIGVASNVNTINKYGVVLKKNPQFKYMDEHIYTMENALKGEELGQVAGVVYRNFFRKMTNREIAYYKKCTMNGDIKLCVTAAMYGDIYYLSDITANYRWVRHGGDNWNSKIEGRNMNGFYFDTFLSLQKYIFKVYHKQMNIDNKLLIYVYESFRYFLNRPTRQNMAIFFHIFKNGYFSKSFLVRYLINTYIQKCLSD